MQYRTDEAKQGQSVFSRKSERQNQMRSIRSRTHTSSFITSPKRHLHPTPARLAGLDVITSASSSSKSIHFSQRPQLSWIVLLTRWDWRGQAREHKKRIVSYRFQPSRTSFYIANRRLPGPRRPDAEPVPQSRGHALPACC